MKLARVGIMAAVALAVATTSWAQKPDFSGTWTLDAAASGMPSAGAGGGAPAGGGGGRGRGGILGMGPTTVKHSADTLVVESSMGGSQVTRTYKLDGSESKNTMTGRGGQTVESMSTAKWDGQRLHIVTKIDMGGQTVENTEVWSVDGSTMTVESTNARGTQKRVYKK